jgi:hypothetical protein
VDQIRLIYAGKQLYVFCIHDFDAPARAWRGCKALVIFSLPYRPDIPSFNHRADFPPTLPTGRTTRPSHSTTWSRGALFTWSCSSAVAREGR